MTTLGVTSGVDPSQWHGAFDCAACGRKRLPAVEFSANAVRVKRAHPERSICCKKCNAEASERVLAAETAKLRVRETSENDEARASGGDDVDIATVDAHECAGCALTKPASQFSNKQLHQKGPGKQRCRSCCARAELAEAAKSAVCKETKLRDAREASRKAELTNAPEKLAVFAREAALEAELVTGLKPLRARRGGRGWGRSGLDPNGTLRSGGGK
jgi:hypothetical protein